MTVPSHCHTPPVSYITFDLQVTELCREVTRLHSEFTPLLLSLAQEATVSVGPMMRPTWWLCPTLEECLTADQRESFLHSSSLVLLAFYSYC